MTEFLENSIDKIGKNLVKELKTITITVIKGVFHPLDDSIYQRINSRNKGMFNGERGCLTGRVRKRS